MALRAAVWHKLNLLLTDRALLRRIGFVFFAFAVFRLLAVVPLPGVDPARLASFFGGDAALLSFLNIFSGGGLQRLSMVLLGVGPYITASIIMQLATVLSPRLKALYHEEGEQGRLRFIMYTRWLTLPLAIVQGWGFLLFLKSQGVVATQTPLEFVANLALVVAGSFLLMWLGELTTEFGIGNGVSLIIFAGIAASIPQVVSQAWLTFTLDQLPSYLALGAIALAATYVVVYLTEAERPIPLAYAQEARMGKARVGSHLPLRLNQAGVIPIIFALSFLVMPGMVARFLEVVLAGTSWAGVAATLGAIRAWFATPEGTIAYFTLYFFLVVAFTYFYTAITFEPHELARDLQRRGAFIPGIRPGEPTVAFLSEVVSRLTLVGAVFLGAIAVLPFLLQLATGVGTFAVGGTALLIAVSVVLDLLRRIEAQLAVREY